MEMIVEFSGVTKQYGTKTAVTGLDLAIPQGEIFALVGPNGAGKTSTLKMLVGLLKITSGSIRVGGLEVGREPGKVKPLLSFVPDVPYVYEKLTPRELLRFTGKLYGMDPSSIAKKGAELLEFFQLSRVRDVLIEEFSHGMRQKAVLAASLLHGPRVLILDEPMVGLDPASIKAFKDYMRQKSSEGMTIILSTHILSMAEELAGRIGIIHRGRMIALGTLAELREKYRSQENLEHMFMRLVSESPEENP